MGGWAFIVDDTGSESADVVVLVEQKMKTPLTIQDSFVKHSGEIENGTV